MLVKLTPGHKEQNELTRFGFSYFICLFRYNGKNEHK
jgi:hypothetical protein